MMNNDDSDISRRTAAAVKERFVSFCLMMIDEITAHTAESIRKQQMPNAKLLETKTKQLNNNNNKASIQNC